VLVFLEITPSTWRQELKTLRKNTEEKQKKDGDDYSDDFESENEAENNKENDVKADKKAVKRRSPIKFVYKPKPPRGNYNENNQPAPLHFQVSESGKTAQKLNSTILTRNLFS